MIETFITTSNCGSWYFSGGGNPFASTLSPNSFSTVALLISDSILLDHSWRYPYEEVGTEESDPCCRVIDELRFRSIVREISLHKEITAETKRLHLFHGLWTFCSSYAEHENSKVPESFKQLVFSAPEKALRQIADEGVPDVLDGKRHALTPILDAMFAGLAAGQICNRVYDPMNYLGMYFNLLKQTPNTAAQRIDDWAVQVSRQHLPNVPLFITKAGYAARLRAPLEEFGFRPKTSDHKGVADLSATMRNMDRILAFRETAVVADLRKRYTALLKAVEVGNINEIGFPMPKDLQDHWVKAKKELRKKLSVSEVMEWWTDILTVPAAIAATFLPLLSVIPLATWTTGKITARMVTHKHAKKYPWYYFAEQVIEAADDMIRRFPRKGKRIISNSSD